MKLSENSAYPYCVGLLWWTILSLLENIHPGAPYIIDPIRTFVVGFIVVRQWYRFPSFGKVQWLESLGVGALVFGFGLLLLSPGERTGGHPGGFNPEALFGPRDITYGLILFHVLGLVIIVPLIQEVFWRGLLMRYLISKDFAQIPIGVCTRASFMVTLACYVVFNFGEWPGCFITAAIVGLWFVSTKKLGNAIAAHTFSNFLWAIYVITTKSWHLW